MIRVLGEAPRVLSGGAVSKQAEPDVAKPTRYNMNLSKQVDEYLASYPYDEVVNIGAMIKTLKQDHGVVGKNASL